MPYNIQKKLMRNKKIHERNILSRFCPNAPRNTTQYLIAEFEARNTMRQRRIIQEALLSDDVCQRAVQLASDFSAINLDPHANQL
jgi:hypothetical protein